MTKEHLTNEEKKGKVKPDKQPENREQAADAGVDRSGLAQLQNQVGNRAVQRMLAQRSGDGAFELDDDTAGRINQARGQGQPLDSATQDQMGAAMGQDFSGVQVHTSRESDELNQQIGAKAFTTGQDIFFKEGAYDPGSSGGQELIAHELTHVVQQGSGAVKGGSGMTVNAPGDVYEQEADSVAKQVTSPAASGGAEAGVQRQEEEEEVQMQEEEEEVQMQEEEEEEVQMQEMEEEEEAV
ncbi:MAG: DUF4157 domain-containing protein [Anaerolineaceae bacterium]|nr:DUF4157 domain-containing protein [Anaerolineaceae bacterium]